MNLMGGGRPRKPDNELSRPRQKKTVKVKALTTPTIENEIKLSGDVLPKKQTPLEYAHTIMNDPSADEIRRDRMAIALLPFFHKKLGEGGRKEKQQDDAEKVSVGKFSSSAPPKLTAVK